MKKLLSLFFLTLFSFVISAQSLEIQGTNFGIEPLEQGKYPFFNRTNMTLGAIPSGYTGWKFTKINANSSYLPGPLPGFQVKPDANGFVYAMVADTEKPAVCAQWATDNGWELVSAEIISFGSAINQDFSIYKKACVAGNWINIVQPNTFSGALVIAPDISVPVTQTIETARISVRASGWMETSVLDNGTIAYANRTYVFNSVKAELKGLNYTRYNGGIPPRLRVTVEETGDVYIAVSNEDVSYDPVANGWTEVSGLNFGYNDPNNTTFTVFKKAFVQNDEFSINATGWQGVLLLSSKTIDYILIQNFTPPPGVVIHNSKASTKRFIGSPSIVVLEDGTYLASHDYFGTRTEAFVYKSTDKGQSWECISNILDLKWASIFRRGNEVYLLGIRVNGTEYGNIVIFKSLDNGVTWTEPTNSTNGLLFNGWYHCAPMPVINHNGKLWRGFESMATSGGWGPFGAFMLSVPENADLLNAANWTKSNELQYVAGAVDAWTWLEGNAVVARDGSVKDILRLHYGADDRAAVVDISADGKTASFDPYNGIANISGASKKFTIRYDSVSDLYWTLSSHVLPKDKTGNLERVRNTIALSYSTDLYNWTIKEILLHVEEKAHHGFQYLDWLFEGNDIIAVSRTAWDDETGQADSQHNANYITFHRFKNFRFEKGSTSVGVSATRWFNDAKSAVALTFDDGFKAHYDHAYPVLEQYNIKSTFFVNSVNLVNTGETQKERYGFWSEFKTMADNRHEIASHSLTHPNLTSLSYDVLVDELEKDKENIEAKIGRKCLTHAYPYCLNDTEVQQVAKSLFIGARQCGGISTNAVLTWDECYSINSDLLTWTYPRSLENETASFESIKAKIENDVRKNRNFGVLCIHEVLPFNQLSTSDTYEIATTEWLTQMCRYLDEKRTSGDIWPATFANIVQYAQERDNVRFKRTDISVDSIEYELTVLTFLDTAQFYHPLTISVTLPDGWASAECKIMEGETVLSSNTYAPSNGKILVNVVPDKQKLFLVKKSSSALEKIATNDILLFPNPVNDVLKIKHENTKNGTVEIYNMQGICIKKQAVSDTESKIDVSSIQSGSYILNFVENGKTIYSSMFLKK